eukprot:TRINITY_DN13088_c0_g1_i1.p2 TRINITY_DN13088_c0_g1~~TRINITY_DN13088_c0_g1_i1.p2  ORF type:complete len:100 (+),score=17.23 TRINITY_DN13088_c0_g1_i1:717-1016(+)
MSWTHHLQKRGSHGRRPNSSTLVAQDTDEKSLEVPLPPPLAMDKDHPPHHTGPSPAVISSLGHSSPIPPTAFGVNALSTGVVATRSAPLAEAMDEGCPS